MDIHFMDISLQLSMLLWISIWISLDFYGYLFIDLLWILDPGSVRNSDATLKEQTPVQGRPIPVLGLKVNWVA